MTQNRLRYFDTIKGVAIFLVVMGHVLTMCIRDIDQAFSFKMIGHIHMPLFFFISGYFTYKEKNGHQYILPNLKQRFLQLIVPVLVTGSLWVIYFPHSGLSSPFLHGFTGFWTDLWKNGYWFTLALFQILLIYSFLTIILKRQKKIIPQLITIGITWFLIIIFNRLIPEYYDKIITGDLGKVGQTVLIDLLRERGYDIADRHMDCGIEIFDKETQDTHAGGSGCGCAASVLSAYLLKQLETKKWKRILFVPTGALLSKVSFNEGKPVPGIAHAVVIEAIR